MLVSLADPAIIGMISHDRTNGAEQPGKFSPSCFYFTFLFEEMSHGCNPASPHLFQSTRQIKCCLGMHTLKEFFQFCSAVCFLLLHFFFFKH